MFNLETPDLHDVRIERVVHELRAEDPIAMNRIVDAVNGAAPLRRNSTPARSRRLRLMVASFTVALAGAALWPWGEAGHAQANLGFAQVAEATRAAPHSIARSYDPDGKPTGYTVWREGDKYASELWNRKSAALLSEMRSDGKRMMNSFQWTREVKPPGYRFASLGRPRPIPGNFQYDTLEGILRVYMVKGPEPVPERIGDRLRYKIRPVWARTETMTVDADAKSGRVLEIRSPGSRMVLDYTSAIPAGVFRPRPTDPTITLLDMDVLTTELTRDIARGTGVWLDGSGMLWRVYRGSTERPPQIPGLRLQGRTVSKTLRKGDVVAVGSTPDRVPPATVTFAGKRVPVRKIGMILWWRKLFGPVTP